MNGTQAVQNDVILIYIIEIDLSSELEVPPTGNNGTIQIECPVKLCLDHSAWKCDKRININIIVRNVLNNMKMATSWNIDKLSAIQNGQNLQKAERSRIQLKLALTHTQRLVALSLKQVVIMI